MGRSGCRPDLINNFQECVNAGYDDREGEMVAQVLTDHTIVVTVKDGEITKVVTDGVFDEMSGKKIN